MTKRPRDPKSDIDSLMRELTLKVKKRTLKDTGKYVTHPQIRMIVRWFSEQLKQMHDEIRLLKARG